MKVFSELQLTVTSDSIKDFHRLGKYDQHMKRPHQIIIKFLGATLVLASRSSLSTGITIKPDMSTEEQKIESIPLKERCSLINIGTEGKYIKLQGNGLYVNHKLYAVVLNLQLCLLSNSQPQANVSNVSAPPNQSLAPPSNASNTLSQTSTGTASKDE